MIKVSGEIPKPVITQEPPSGEIYTGERVTLSCGFGGDAAGWEYLWYKDTQGAAVLILETGWTEIFTTDSLTLRCEIQGISAEWNYTWYRDGEQIPLDHTADRYRDELALNPESGRTEEPQGTQAASSSKKRELVIVGDFLEHADKLLARAGEDPVVMVHVEANDVGRVHRAVENKVRICVGVAILLFLSVIMTEAFWKRRDSGLYQCEGTKGSQHIFSNFHNLTVSAVRPQAAVVTDPPDSLMYTGETVTLSCDIITGSGWRYSWVRNKQERLESLYPSSTESQQKHILHSVTESDSGEYICQGERGQNPTIQSLPGSLILNVSAGERPKPVIIQEPPSGEIYTGERVTLSCGFRGDPNNTLNLHLSHVLYCPVFLYIIFNTFRCKICDVAARPQAVLILETGWTEIFTTDSLILRCEIQGISAEWNYTWYRDEEQIPLDHTGDRYRVRSGNGSYHSEYKCRGNRPEKPSNSIFSDGLVPVNRIHCAVENMVRICVGVAILLFLSAIMTEAFWKRLRQAKMCCTVTITGGRQGEEDD
ncbi:uncharacterized protein LOC118780404 [Megalops cyprinoides]|uniref:uncharacterized protein LOC118780404 n=1 Tax=Megalops cyprinoides TaxID=118141 RepID=UPI0018646F8F|nr:uncharacterized protein LOC118780404 [Megalops cyprinoides]